MTVFLQQNQAPGPFHAAILQSRSFGSRERVPCEDRFEAAPVRRGAITYDDFGMRYHLGVSKTLSHVASGVFDARSALTAFAGKVGEEALAEALVEAGHISAAAALSYVEDGASRDLLAVRWLLEHRLQAPELSLYRRVSDVGLIPADLGATNSKSLDEETVTACLGRSPRSAYAQLATPGLTVTQLRLCQQALWPHTSDQRYDFGMKYHPGRALSAPEIALLSLHPRNMRGRRWPGLAEAGGSDPFQTVAGRMACGPHRTSYATRLLAACIQGSPAYQVRAVPPQNKTCCVCDEPFSVDRLGVKPGACQHPADMCVACIRQAALANTTDTCPYPDCQTALTPNDMIRWGLDGQHADGLARRIVLRWQAQKSHWYPSPSESCLGGSDGWPRGGRLDCDMCERSAHLPHTIEVDAIADRPQIKRLLKDLGGVTMNGKIRECYHCGAATQHRSDCSHMKCLCCGRNWDFIRGPRSSNEWPLSAAQRYVPTDSLLVRAGIFKGLKPGKRYSFAVISLVARANAIRLGYWYL